MTLDSAPAVVAVTLVTVATLTIGTWGFRFSRTTSDFYVASRSVRPGLNASAIGGEYLSAASFLGIAGLVFTSGAEMLWYPIGWTAGYRVMLTLVAAPLRRSGAYTLPDFAEERLASRGVRRLCSLLVVTIGWLYLIPQLQGVLFLVYTAGLMFLLRTFASGWSQKNPIVTTIVCAGITCTGLSWLGSLHPGDSAVIAFTAATVFGVGKTFFVPTMLGLASEQLPRGGALLMSIMGGCGMLATAVALPVMGARIDKLGPGAALQMMALLPAAGAGPCGR